MVCQPEGENVRTYKWLNGTRKEETEAKRLAERVADERMSDKREECRLGTHIT